MHFFKLSSQDSNKSPRQGAFFFFTRATFFFFFLQCPIHCLADSCSYQPFEFQWHGRKPHFSPSNIQTAHDISAACKVIALKIETRGPLTPCTDYCWRSSPQIQSEVVRTFLISFQVKSTRRQLWTFSHASRWIRGETPGSPLHLRQQQRAVQLVILVL